MTNEPANIDLDALRLAIGAAESKNAAPELLREAKLKLQQAADAGAEHLPALHKAEREWRDSEATSFYFVRASAVRNCTVKTLPRLQDLQRDHPDWIVKKPIDMTSALLGEYRTSMCGVSHRWEDPKEPDTTGAQLIALKNFLKDHREIELVWMDFPSMPQQPRSMRKRPSSRRCSPT